MKTKTTKTELTNKELNLLIEGLSKAINVFELEESPNSLPAKLMDKLFEAKEFTKSKTELKRQALKEKCLKLKSNFDWHWSRMHGCDKSLKRTREIAKEMEELQILLIK